MIDKNVELPNLAEPTLNEDLIHAAIEKYQRDTKSALWLARTAWHAGMKFGSAQHGGEPVMKEQSKYFPNESLNAVNTHEVADYSLIAAFRDLATDMRKHGNDHLHDEDLLLRSQAAVEGVCADRIDALLPKTDVSEPRR